MTNSHDARSFGVYIVRYDVSFIRRVTVEHVARPTLLLLLLLLCRARLFCLGTRVVSYDLQLSHFVG